jgi:tetraacyldisaccharide 4'-kinase
MSATDLHRRIISGQAGPWAAPARWLLAGVAGLYTQVVQARNRRYDRRGPAYTPTVPTISVGNLTVGGTGKTPFVLELVARLFAAHLNPVVVSRGYGSEGSGPNDEELLLRRRFPALACVADPDRVSAARVAIQRNGAGAIVLDDGFQHRRLGRHLDIVLIDATNPFGHDHVLPRGLLREPIGSLTRADLVVITRADQAPRHELDELQRQLDRLVPENPRILCCHRLRGLEHLDGTPATETLAGRRVALFASIGNPRAFLTSVRALEAEVVGTRWWPDHHRYQPRDLASLRSPDAFPDYELLVTTEKDAVKLASLEFAPRHDVRVARVEIDFLDDGSTILDQVLSDLIATFTSPTDAAQS